MIVSARNGQLTNGAPYWCEWTAMYFTKIYDLLGRKDIFEKDGSFDMDFKGSVENYVWMGYTRMKLRFEVDEQQLDDEADTLMRMLSILSPQEYLKMARLIIEPYTNLELDKKSLDRIANECYT